METLVIKACTILFTLYVWNHAMCCLRCTATVLFEPAYDLLIVRYEYIGV